MARKTIEVDAVREFANRSLATVVDEPLIEGVNRRWGVIGVVEATLFATDNYKGYQYLPSENDAEGRGLRPDYDQTRRRYF